MINRVVLPFENWPVEDRRLWQAAMEGSSRFLEGGRAARWQPRTLINARNCYGRWLQWLCERGLLDTGLSPIERVNPLTVRQFILDERQRVGLVTLSTRLFYLLGTLETLAPGLNWNWLRRESAKVKRQAAKLPRKRPQLVHGRHIFDWSIGLMQQAVATDTAGAVDIDLYLDGLMIAVMTAVALRIENFANLRLGDQVRRVEGRWIVLIDGAETKTRRAVAMPLPETLAPWLDLYADTFRPQLIARQAPLRNDKGAFWIGLDGHPLLSQGIRNHIKRRTAAAFGKPILPHTFRKIAQTTFMVERPEYGAYAPALLGHTSAQTMEKHYFIAQGQLAVETYHELDGRSRRRSAAAEGAKPETGSSSDRKLKAFIVGSVVTGDARRFRRQSRSEAAGPNGRPSRRQSRLERALARRQRRLEDS